ncbi:MAG: replication initiator protein [Arizlama microvirus]|nr:MAG: replication initiator protein [Arizlama microvirus]
MPCNSPIAGWQSPAGGPLSFGPKPPKPSYKPLKVPCGQCAGCRLERSRQWAMRCVHEAQLHDENSFVTLTYSDEKLPQWGSLRKSDLQKFFKRLRDHKGPFRYYACGEYGDATRRAHYHACIFGIDFADKTHFRKIGEHNLYISAELEKIWGHGNTSIGALTFETAAYTARYVMKKGLGKQTNNYVRLDEETGEIIPLVQPYAAMSLRCNWRDENDQLRTGGIGAQWLQKYHSDIYGHDKDFLVMRGKKLKPAKYYDKLYDKIDTAHMAEIKKQRIDNATEMTDNELRAREEITRARIINRRQV